MTNPARALLSTKWLQTPKLQISYINTPANTKANLRQWGTSLPSTESGSRTEELVEKGIGKEIQIGHAPHLPSGSCPLITTWDTPCCQGSMICPTPQVSQPSLALSSSFGVYLHDNKACHDNYDITIKWTWLFLVFSKLDKRSLTVHVCVFTNVNNVHLRCLVPSPHGTLIAAVCELALTCTHRNWGWNGFFN